MILKVFFKRKILGDISVEYLDSISVKKLKGITRKISGRYFWKNLRGSLEKYLGSISEKNLRVITREIFVGYFEEEFRGSLRNFQDLNFWDATLY
jgi:hypothetical protein